MKKGTCRAIAGLLAVLTVIAVLPAYVLAEDHAVVISTAEQLFAFAAEVNGGNTYKGVTVRLEANIDLGGENDPWTPIGTSSTPFEGIFDGGYHVISGLYIASGSDVGLFGRVNGGTVKNLVVDGEVSGSSNVAGIVGCLDGGGVQNCGSRADVSGGSNVGGVVGSVNNDCKIENCFNIGSVAGSVGYIGGVTGQHFRAGIVENCYNIGAVTGPAAVGGVSGGHKASSPVLTNCYNAGVVTDSKGDGNGVCAVLGQARSYTITNCFYIKNEGAADSKDGVAEVGSLTAGQLGEAFADGVPYPVLKWEEMISSDAPVTLGFTEKNERSRELADLIRAAVNSAKAHGNVGSGTLLGSDAFRSGASSTDTDWTALTMARFGYYDMRNEYRHLIDDGSGYDDYLAAIQAYIEKTYAENSGILHSAKATEWHRAVLTVTALGGDPTRFGEYGGKPIDLIADGSYDCVLNGGPGKQGINGWIFGLIAMDTGMFDVPEQARYSRETFITEILKQQLTDGVGGNKYGGWVLSGGFGAKSDIDITAMAIQALAPYYNDGTVYTYINTGSKEERSVTVRRCVDEALDVLSSRMDKNGGFSSWGSKNLEGISQVIVALCSLGIDPAADARFVTSGGKTLLDGLLQFRLPEGGFCHVIGGDWNSMANDQATYALVAYWRLENEMRALYDMRGNFTDEQISAIGNAAAAIDSLPEPSSDNYKEQIKKALDAFRAVPAGERRYVTNYSSLASALELVGGEDKLDTNDPYAVSIKVTKQPNKLRYFEGELFDPSGMEVTAAFSDGTERTVNEYRCAPTSELTTEDRTVTVVYGILKTSVTITVEEKLPWAGSGTAEDPYLIGTEEELTYFAEYINKGENFADKTAVLTANLDLSGILWTPIGKSQRLAFAGTFDGRGFCIDNLYSSLGGLFGYAADSAVIRNVGVASGEIGSDSGYSSFFGGILGWSEGADVINCWNGADIYCSSYSGGVVGTVRGGESAISGCFNRGNVIGHESSTHLGGIVGHLDTGHPVTVEDCYNTGDITGGYSVGGIVGAMQDGPHTVQRCYNAGTVKTISLNLSMSGRAGAVVGDSTRKENAVEDCYYLAGSCEAGGISKDAGIEDTTASLSEAQMKDGTLLSSLGDAFKVDPYELVNGGYPILLWQATEEADAVDEVISLIDAIGEVTLEREDAIRAARAAYDALDDETLWALVSNYGTLTEAEKLLQDLKDAAEPSDPADPSDPGSVVPPQTGDTENLPFCILLMFISGLAVVFLSAYEKTRQKR